MINLNKFETFNTAASEATASKNEAGAANEKKKSATNIAGWSAFAIHRNGAEEQLNALTASIAKDGKHEKHKGIVSRAKAVLAYFKENEAITTNKGTFGRDAIFAIIDSDTIPDVSIYGLAQAIAPKKEASIPSEANEVIKLAMAAASTHHGFNLTPKQFDSLPHTQREVFMNEALQRHDAIVTEKRQKGLEEVVAIMNKYDCAEEVFAFLQGELAKAQEAQEAQEEAA